MEGEQRALLVFQFVLVERAVGFLASVPLSLARHLAELGKDLGVVHLEAFLHRLFLDQEIAGAFIVKEADLSEIRVFIPQSTREFQPVAGIPFSTLGPRVDAATKNFRVFNRFEGAADKTSRPKD